MYAAKANVITMRLVSRFVSTYVEAFNIFEKI